MNIEENRLKTFEQWPETAGVNPMRMARGGFYYTGRGTEVQCFLCGTRIADWEYGDQVMTRHRRADPDCPFVRDPASTCNVPIIESSDSIRARATASSSSSTSSSSTTTTTGNSDASEGTSKGPLILQSQNPRIEYGTYEQRLSSFQNWPTFAAVTPESLARAGFYYLQQEDMVECAYCRGIMRMWEPGDDPDIEHRIGFPNCDFYSLQEANSALPTAEKEDFTNVKLLSGTASDLHKLGIQKHIGPRQAKHPTYEGRLRTFQGWPENLRQTPEMLATAGFYYVGSGDQVRCFHCDGGLHNWEADDDPWVEHAKWFPTCGFVSIIRGQEFIKQCVDNRQPLDPSIYNGVSEDEHGEDTRGQTSVSQASNSNSTVRQHHHAVTDSAVEELLHSAPATTALQLGLCVGRVKAALRERMERFGVPYTNADQLIEHVRRIHLDEESNGLDNNTETSVPELANLLSHLKCVQSTSRSETQENNGEINDGSVEATTNGDNHKFEHSKKDKRLESKTENGPLSLEEENRRLKEARLCKICMDREVSVVFLPCGHLSTCHHCAPSLTDCPMCRQEIRATVRTFLA